MLKRLLFLIVLGSFFLSCGSGKPKPNVPAEERLQYAMKKFDDGDYLDAKTEFRIIVLNFPGHNIVDKAQYYLAECHFKMKEYILATAEYEKLIRMFPNSAFVDDAQFKIGLGNYKLSPKYSLDQENTLKAIEELQKFAEDFPESEYVDEATKLIQKCREKLAKKEYKNGELYRKMTYYEAAIIYFETILDNYYDTKYAEDAQFWLAECLRRAENYDRSIEEFNRFLKKYPDSKRKASITKLLKKIEIDKQNSTTSQEKVTNPENHLLSNPEYQ